MTDRQIDMIRFESGEMSFEEQRVFFQELIDTGDISQLKSYYSKVAQWMLEEGYCL
jgi:hypothetical protein